MTRTQRTTSRRTFGRLRLLAMVPAALMVILPMVSMFQATAAGTPKVKITPGKDLGDGQYIRVAWSGFGDAQATFFRQCKQNPSNITADCAPNFPRSGQSNSKGVGTTYLPIIQGDVQAQNGVTSFTCNETHPCTIAVLVHPDTLAGGAFATLRYAPSPSSCPDPGDQSLQGSGSSSVYLTLNRWLATTCKAPYSLSLQYSVNNSPSGRDNLIAGAADFAATAEPFRLEEQEQLFEDKNAFTYVPVSQSSLVLAYRIYEQDVGLSVAGPQITDLRLTPSAVARAFTGQNKNWDLDKEINRLNPKHRNKFPPLVRPLPRAEHSAATRQFIQWLTATAGEGLPKDWEEATSQSPDTWPSHWLGVDQGILGADHVALAIANPQDSDFYTFGYIGYMDASLAEYYGLPIAKIQNAAGKFVAATPKSVEAGLKHMKKYADDTTLIPDYLNDDPNAYPIPTVNYVTASTNKLDPARAAVLGKFLRYAVGNGQKNLALGYYGPLSKALVAQANTAITSIEKQDGKPTKPKDPYDIEPGGDGDCEDGQTKGEDGTCQDDPCPDGQTLGEDGECHDDGGGETPPGETPPGETPPGETPPGETPPGEIPPQCTPTGDGTDEGTGETGGDGDGESTPPSEGEDQGDGKTGTGDNVMPAEGNEDGEGSGDEESPADDGNGSGEVEPRQVAQTQLDAPTAVEASTYGQVGTLAEEGTEDETKGESEAPETEGDGNGSESEAPTGTNSTDDEDSGKSEDEDNGKGKDNDGATDETDTEGDAADCAAGEGFEPMEFPSTTASTARLVTMSLGALALMGLVVGPGMQATARTEDLRRLLRRFTKSGPGGARP